MSDESIPETTEEIPAAANIDVIAEGRSRWRLPRFRRPEFGRGTKIALWAVGTLFVLGLAGAAYAGYDYSEEYSGRILPGSTIAGVDVSGMTSEDAFAAVTAAIEPQLHRTITVSWKEKTWRVTPKELGARNDADAAVAAAIEASSEASFLKKIRMSIFGEELGFEREIAITYPRQGIRGYISGIASNLDAEVRDATIDYSTGWVKVRPEREGRVVKARKSRRSLLEALQTGSSTVNLRVKVTEPEVTRDDFDRILLLRIGENKLYLYDDGKITHTYDVATGQPEYPTPTGVFEITEKRYMPTWINPDPEGWGKDMPLTIPPGPGNPLGTRALNWSAEGIRFHGTSADYSIGYNASHGCVRMHMWDVEELYELVEVGTPIVSVVADSLKPLYVSAPDPIPVPDDVEEGKTPEEPDSNDGGRKKKGAG